jgi:hypothetical protein
MELSTTRSHHISRPATRVIPCVAFHHVSGLRNFDFAVNHSVNYFMMPIVVYGCQACRQPNLASVTSTLLS